ncbi:amidohydrolase family protein [Roseobacter ponti]|uniref:Amidohydrolase family protein n=1 Tax=Roseobacter ponti TaxID=1891787 RepID=A0A858SXC6_9RHOB|nr:amidohydrolase family protein [Roseobacter ponti]QJF52668.1 amidohydrolase family protein [Roseobacter ponti]
MNAPVDAVLHDILIPRALLRDDAGFGGTPAGDCLRGDLLIRDGRARRLQPGTPGDAPRIVLPALTEAHCHLDKCHTIARLGTVGGDLIAAIAAQKEDKANWSEADLSRRARIGLAEAQAAGCIALRTHVDWGDTVEAPLNWSVLTGLAQETSGLTLQCAALTGIDQLAEDGFCDQVARRLAQDGGVLGAFVLGHKRVQDGLTAMITSADKYGLALDFHVDEGLGDYNGLETICDALIAARFAGPVLCGHAVSLMDRHGDDLTRILDKLARAQVSVCALPTTNLYLQDRRSGTPDRRGLTRLREMQAAGVPVVVGSDNVADAFCPMGQHDPMAALHLAALTGHLDPPMGRWLRSVTVDAATALGLDPVFVDGARADDLRLSTAPDLAGLVAGRAPLLKLTDVLQETVQ